MATISRIVALPSATQYNPTSPPFPQFTFQAGIPLTPFAWGQVSYGQTPTNTIKWATSDGTFYKNKETSQYRYFLYRYSDGLLLKDGILGTFTLNGPGTGSHVTDLGPGLIAGTKYTLSTYTLVNGTRSSLSSNWTFTAMTAPDSSPTINGGYGTSGYANSVNGNKVNLTLSTITTNWGGASSVESDGHRFYDIQLLRPNGSVAYSAVAYVFGSPSDDAAYYTLTPYQIEAEWEGEPDGTGGVNSEPLTVWVQARTYGGAAARNQSPASAFDGPVVLFPVAPPVVFTVTPSSGTGAGGDLITLDGYYLKDPISVTIGGLQADIFDDNFNQILVITPPNTTGSTGAKDIVVTTAGGSTTKTGGFTYNTVAPPFFPPFFPYFGPPIY
jgi:hypothetical protein